MGRSSSLVPDSFDEFRSVEFWDGFFKERGEKAFEWYGDWRQLRPLLANDCRPGREILVVGCGNSELSAQLYDGGCEQITNIDFSKRVIVSMMKQNLRQRPKMKWQVGDMTNMKFPDGSFHVVLDKGGLDALMGEDSSEGSEAGRKLLTESSRVLQAGGCYLCITLAQTHVLRLLLDCFREGWTIEVSSVPPSPDMARSPLQPFFIRAVKAQLPGACQGILSLLKRAPKAPNGEQLAETCQMLEDEMAARAAGGLAICSPSEDLERLHPGRRLCRDLGYGKRPRFSAVVLDLDSQAAAASVHQCCVFLIPQGREGEWLFASDEGQWQVARQCSCKRVILVAMNRGHNFESTAAVRAEVGPLVRPLTPVDVRGKENAVPIMTTGDGVGSRRILEETQSALSGSIVVEDVGIQEAEEMRYCRRLVFTSNRNLIQSEAFLLPVAGSSAKKPNASARRGKPETMEIDDSSLSMDYHCHVAAALASRSPASGSQMRCLIVGLGGGGLAAYLHRFLAASVTAVELDETVISLARRHFGFQEGPSLQVQAGDGLTVVKEMAETHPGSLDALIVDAGSGDASLAMSCPPPPFLQPGFLHDARRLLNPSGLLAVNCVTRLESAFISAAAAVKEVFESVSFSTVDEDINRVLFATSKGAEVDSDFCSREHLTGMLSSSLDLADRVAGVRLETA